MKKKDIQRQIKLMFDLDRNTLKYIIDSNIDDKMPSGNNFL